MIDALFSQPNYVAAKKMLDATVLRQEAIASNLANLETPHYRRLDVSSSFSTQLKQAMASDNPAQIASVQPRLEPDNTQDGDTVQLESELVALNKNYLAHTLETQLVSGALLRMRLAITGRSG